MRRGVVALALLLSVVGGSIADAAEPTGPSKGLKAYGLGWVQSLPPEAFPPPRYAVCIVDTGVAITPDTPADDPNGPIIERSSVYDQSGSPPDAGPEQLHGTRMASAAVAPRNGWGAVGLNPLGRVRSVRAVADGTAGFTASAYVRGINACLSHLPEFPTAAISLSLGCSACDVSEATRRALVAAVERAKQRGIVVLAAAGNSPGPVQFPASVDGVLAVAAGGLKGRLCRYASWGAQAALIAPACPVYAAEPVSGAFEPRADGGSSVATIETAAFIAALRTLRPDVASSDEVVAWLRLGARRVQGRPILNGRRAAERGGLAPVLRRASPRS